MEGFLNEILEQTKEELLRNVDETYHQELLSEYKSYLKKVFKGLRVKDEYYDSALKEEVSINNDLLKKYSSDDKLSLYLGDKAYEKLNALSYKAYQLGLKRANNNKVSDGSEISKYKEQMKTFLRDVREFNKLRAREVYNEGLLDFDYASGSTDIYSMRLSHAIVKKEKNEEER